MQKIGLGTAAIGRPQYINIKSKETKPFDKKSFTEDGLSVLELAYENGIRYFDTSPGYGMAESILIDWLKSKSDSEIELATKWGYTYVAEFKKDALVHEVKEHSLEKLVSQWEVSKQLKPFLNTYQIHSATFETGVLKNKEVLHTLSEYQKKFDLKIGLSTTGANQLEVLKEAYDVEVNGQQLFDVFQVTHNILDQSVTEFCNKMALDEKRIIVKEALANGRLLPNKNFTQYDLLYNELKKLAKKYDVGADAIALRFCVQSLDSYSVLSGALEKEHLLSNLKANGFVLEEEELFLLKSFAISTDSYWNERKKLSWN